MLTQPSRSRAQRCRCYASDFIALPMLNTQPEMYQPVVRLTNRDCSPDGYQASNSRIGNPFFLRWCIGLKPYIGLADFPLYYTLLSPGEFVTCAQESKKSKKHHHTYVKIGIYTSTVRWKYGHFLQI
jgi:hypothetical protein